MFLWHRCETTASIVNGGFVRNCYCVFLVFSLWPCLIKRALRNLQKLASHA
jgi:hypothetical protein